MWYVPIAMFVYLQCFAQRAVWVHDVHLIALRVSEAYCMRRQHAASTLGVVGSV